MQSGGAPAPAGARAAPAPKRPLSQGAGGAGFTNGQLAVLKSQILAFRSLKARRTRRQAAPQPLQASDTCTWLQHYSKRSGLWEPQGSLCVLPRRRMCRSRRRRSRAPRCRPWRRRGRRQGFRRGTQPARLRARRPARRPGRGSPPRRPRRPGGTASTRARSRSAQAPTRRACLRRRGLPGPRRRRSAPPGRPAPPRSAPARSSWCAGRSRPRASHCVAASGLPHSIRHTWAVVQPLVLVCSRLAP
jgi:hypothetical protein